MWEQPSLEQLQSCLKDSKNPIGMRMRAAYYLRQEHGEHPETVVQILGENLHNEQHGALMRHEFAYVMGQLRDDRCCPILSEILQDTQDDIMVRHEAAEALGAIGSESSLPILQATIKASDSLPELAGTCQLAVSVIEWRRDGRDPENPPAACACMLNPYSSVDPAPPHPSHASVPFSELGEILRNTDLDLFARYRAMFSLRNRGGTEAVHELCETLVRDTSSALLRHEVAYVLGQLQHRDSVEALETSLRNENEHSMVRHEAAEALGAIEDRWEDVERILGEFQEDLNPVIRESCLVALDAVDYWKQPTSFAQQKSDVRILQEHFNVQA